MGKNMSFLILCLIVMILFTGIGAGPLTTDNNIKVDQFGYRPGDEKIAVISNPVTGYNSSDPFTPGRKRTAGCTTTRKLPKKMI